MVKRWWILWDKVKKCGKLGVFNQIYKSQNSNFIISFFKKIESSRNYSHLWYRDKLMKFKSKQENEEGFWILSKFRSKRQQNLSTKNFQKHQVVINENKLNLTMYPFPLVLYLCILQQCLLWIHFMFRFCFHWRHEIPTCEKI